MPFLPPNQQHQSTEGQKTRLDIQNYYCDSLWRTIQSTGRATDRREVLAPAEERRYADERRQDPDGGDDGRHVLGGALDGVLERARDDEVAVDADGAEVEDGRGAEQDVERRPGVADGAVQRPVTLHLHIHSFIHPFSSFIYCKRHTTNVQCTITIQEVKVAHTRLQSVDFRR